MKSRQNICTALQYLFYGVAKAAQECDKPWNVFFSDYGQCGVSENMVKLSRSERAEEVNRSAYTKLTLKCKVGRKSQCLMKIQLFDIKWR
jgi:hypothetical protein